MNLKLLTFVPFVLFFLFDNYLGGIRILDFLGLFLLLVLTGFKMLQQKGRLALSHDMLLVIFLFLIFVGTSGFIRQNELKPHMGIALGLLVFVCYYSFGPIDPKYVKAITWLLMISTGSVFFQLIYTKIFGRPLRLVFLNLDELRATFGGETTGLFRPTGFFMEPNNYCVPTIMLLLLRKQIQQRPFDLLSYIVIFSLFISFSLWGVFIAWMLVVYDLVSRKKKQLALLFVTLTFVSFGLLFKFLDETSLLRIAVLDRTVNVLESAFTNRREEMVVFSQEDYAQYMDPSYQGRYGVIKDLSNPSQWDLGTFFGHGISTSDFQLYGGANGVSFILYSVGIFGILALLLVAYLAKIKFGTLVIILVSLLSYPLVTYFLWWAWLALLLRASYHIKTQSESFVSC